MAPPLSHPSASHLDDHAAIFSPTVARIAASTARDWNAVDSWLAAKFPGRSPPPFERNPETLRALLALVSLNETADETRDVLARAEADALNELHADVKSPAERSFAEALLDSVEAGLTREGRVALDSMASMAVDMGMAHPEPEHLGQKLVDAQGQVFAVEQAARRIEIMQRYLEDEAGKIRVVLKELQEDDFNPPTDLAKRNLELQRKIKTIAAKLPELRDRVTSTSPNSSSGSYVTVDELVSDEARYLAALAKKRELEADLASFHDLPTKLDDARSELDAMRSELRALTRRRDAVFEGLVEAESPRKRHR
jgi:HAUS augmin-like complex subunit 1